MAFEKAILNTPSFITDANLAAKQFFCVRMTAVDSTVGLCDAAGEFVTGIAQSDNTGTGAAITVMQVGISRVEAGGTLTANDFWGTDAAGKAVKVESTNTGADVGKWAMGQVITGAASGEIATVTVGVSAHLVEAT